MTFSTPPEIVMIAQKQLMGMTLDMSLAKDHTPQLFRTFMPRRRELLTSGSQPVFDVKRYPKDYFTDFDPWRQFTKWAAMEVISPHSIPEGMVHLILKEGLYASFEQDGSDPNIFKTIFEQWLPTSGYLLDDRLHFDVLQLGGEETICIPVKTKDLTDPL